MGRGREIRQPGAREGQLGLKQRSLEKAEKPRFKF